ncbi:hypothetical protein WSM22_07760 [Cytophagales bacterium WSM2-2]|nr:hypothetical protein WSM22_07760 [Cytophagales bacterium WSM2-2]
MMNLRFIKVGLFLLLVSAGFSSNAQDKGSEITKSIFFGGGSYYIDDEQASDLSRWLDSIPNLLQKYEIQLISHTDNIGGKRYNQWLSEMRSQMVHGLLIQKDIPETMIHVKDWGLENPVYTNETYKGLILNRRVDVVLHPIVF